MAKTYHGSRQIGKVAHSTDFAGFDNLGKAVEAMGKDAEAIADFDKAIKIAPEKAAVYADKGRALFREGKYEDAAASYRQAIEHHKDFSEAQNGLGASLLQLVSRPKMEMVTIRKGTQPTV